MALMDSIMNLLKGVLGGQQGAESGDMMSNLVQQIIENGFPGGAGGLLQQLQQAGLGEQVQSWLSNGPNMPVSPDQIHDALGGQIGQLAQQFGVPPDVISQAMSQFLPGLIDRMSQNGRLER
jgi:uncharacterized protein YidB (DUF937 family)